MMNPRSAPVTSMAESMHEGQHLVEHAARPERAQALQQGGDLAKVADRGARVLLERGARQRLLVEQEHHLSTAAAAKPHQIAVRQRFLGDLLAVDERAIPRATVAEHVLFVVACDVGVVARHVAAHELQIIAAATADGKRGLLERHNAPPEGVSDFEAPKRHQESSMECRAGTAA